MIIEFINFWTAYWILAYGSTIGFILISLSGLAAVGAWIKIFK